MDISKMCGYPPHEGLDRKVSQTIQVIAGHARREKLLNQLLSKYPAYNKSWSREAQLNWLQGFGEILDKCLEK